MSKNRFKKLLRAKKDRYRVNTHVEDGVYNDRFCSTSYHSSLKEARATAIKQEKYEKSLADHSLVHIWSDITSNKKKYKAKRKDKSMSKKKSNSVSNKKNDSYSKGKRWGYAVASGSIQTSRSNVHKMDKAMQTCAKNARTGTKKLNPNERQAYKGIADGMYDAIRKAERN